MAAHYTNAHFLQRADPLTHLCSAFRISDLRRVLPAPEEFEAAQRVIAANFVIVSVSVTGVKLY